MFLNLFRWKTLNKIYSLVFQAFEVIPDQQSLDLN
jgi:hypothetical protein